MRAKQLPRLDWPVHLFQDIGGLEMLDEDDHFGEAADVAATAETLSFSNDLTSIVRYHYVETHHHAVH